MMIFTLQDTSGLGYKRMNARGKGLPVPRFWFLVSDFKGVELIGLV